MEDKKSIIVISSLWTGMKPFFLDGNTRTNGMPAFKGSIELLLNTESVEKVYFVFFGKEIEDKFSLPRLYEKKTFAKSFSYKRKILAPLALMCLLFFCLKLVILKKVKVLYGHGPIAGICGIISILTGIPNVRRLYGTFLFSEINNSKWSIFIKHPLEYLTYSLPAKAVIITNDGTHGDRVYSKIGNSKSEFLFLHNGIEKSNYDVSSITDIMSELNLEYFPDICYVARIDKWKRQHKFLEILKELITLNKDIQAIIVGQIIDQKYYNDLLKYIQYNKMGSNVNIITGISHRHCQGIIENVKASFSLYEVSNLGNVLIESLSLGTAVVSENINMSLQTIDKNCYFDINTAEIASSAKEINILLNDENKLNTLAENGKEFVNRNLLTIKERASIEIVHVIS